MTGILNLDKPPGISSAGAVARVKRLLPRGTKIGHAGTLDPFATGVLLLLIGKSTKLAERLMSEPKQYETTIKLGATTETLDPDSPEIPAPPITLITPPPLDAVQAVLQGFIGPIEQLPPIYSALKIAGQPAYKRARRGEAVELKPRTIHIHAIELLDYAWPLLKIRIDCGRGTYIRALARDIAAALGTTGYLTALRRTRVGPFTARGAARLEGLTSTDLPSLLATETP